MDEDCEAGGGAYIDAAACGWLAMELPDIYQTPLNVQRWQKQDPDKPWELASANEIKAIVDGNPHATTTENGGYIITGGLHKGMLMQRDPSVQIGKGPILQVYASSDAVYGTSKEEAEEAAPFLQEMLLWARKHTPGGNVVHVNLDGQEAKKLILQQQFGQYFLNSRPATLTFSDDGKCSAHIDQGSDYAAAKRNPAPKHTTSQLLNKHFGVANVGAGRVCNITYPRGFTQRPTREYSDISVTNDTKDVAQLPDAKWGKRRRYPYCFIVTISGNGKNRNPITFQVGKKHRPPAATIEAGSVAKHPFPVMLNSRGLQIIKTDGDPKAPDFMVTISVQFGQMVAADGMSTHAIVRNELEERIATKVGCEHYFFPIFDWQAEPRYSKFTSSMENIKRLFQRLNHNDRVVMHCSAGCGRSAAAMELYYWMYETTPTDAGFVEWFTTVHGDPHEHLGYRKGDDLNVYLMQLALGGARGTTTKKRKAEEQITPWYFAAFADLSVHQT